MKKRDLVKIIKEVIEEGLLTEIDIKSEEPKGYEYFDISNDEKQYCFQTKKGNKYRFSLKRSCLNIQNEDIISLYNKKNDKNCYDFLMMNFLDYEDNVNSSDSFERKTKRDEPIQTISNILWLIYDFINRNTNELYFAFSADDKRMSLYSNLLKKLSNDFSIFNKYKYDERYQHDLIIIIKK